MPGWLRGVHLFTPEGKDSGDLPHRVVLRPGITGPGHQGRRQCGGEREWVCQIWLEDLFC